MKTIVLDTSVIVQDPSILATLKDKFRLVVPSVVLRQIQQMNRQRLRAQWQQRVVEVR